ncbi:MAG: N-acetyltransferase [Flavobacterium sp.]|nr:MAG: N-acetyltransferase [Flavobacterium sp.]
MSKFFKYLKVRNIDVLIYRMDEPVQVAFPRMQYLLQSKKMPDGKLNYFMEDDGRFVHRSLVYGKLNVLKLVGKSGPAIGNCVTSEAYRGQSIYPFVINNIASKLLLKKKVSEVFIIVNSDNIASIRGIEKAGFELFAKVKAKRFLAFYFNKKIQKA